MSTTDQLMRFSTPTRAWFRAAFAAPTPVQCGAWEEISQGHDALVIAPTGSGKTLAAFLASLDHVLNQPSPGKGVRVVYVSPLKALGVDVERNLRVPLAGITTTALELGLVVEKVRVGVRSGDTPATERRRLVTSPPQILITTPESLFLMLSSAAAASLTAVETVIVDEIHYLAGTKRGAHLGVSLERLDALNTQGKIQRLGLSATVRPTEVVARFLGGARREVHVVAPPANKTWQLDLSLPVEDMTVLDQPVGLGRPTDAAPPATAVASIWPHVEQRIFELVMSHRSTICFCNSRALAEKLTSHLNLLYRDVAPDDDTTLIARTHHGSVAKEIRAEIEADLKAGRLACVVATNSLELGIDMGAVDLVIQVGSPPSVASGLQRIGRGGHQVDAVSHGVLFPLSRSDLLVTTVVTQRMAAGEIEPARRLANPLDVLAQHLVSLCLDQVWTPDDLFDLVRRADCFTDLPRAGFDAVVEMLTGRYPSEDFVELRPRLAWDRVAGTLAARPGARRLVTTSGGTIPDRGQFPVFIAGDDSPKSGKHAVSRRVGELDEEMVYESRVGDTITLGTSAWRIETIDANQVVVTPVPGQVGRIPFWHGDEISRPVDLGRAIQGFVHEAGKSLAEPGQPPPTHSFFPTAEKSPVFGLTGLDPWAVDNLRAYLAAQRAHTGVLPDAHTIVVELNRDEMGAWRVFVHCQLGRSVLSPWAMALQRRLREISGLERALQTRPFVSDDGFTLRLGEVEDPRIGHLLGFDPAEIERIVTEETQSSAMFAAHFRQCSARALLLPRRDPTKRSPLWQQRLRSAQLLGVAASYPSFPIIAEALRECLVDVFDLTALKELMGQIAARAVQIVELETATPSPFAQALLFGYTGAFLYDDDQPLAERAAVASLVDPALLASLLGNQSPAFLDAEALAAINAEVQRLTPGWAARTKESCWDMLRELGPLTLAECAERCETDPRQWLDELTAVGRVIVMMIAGREMLAVAEDQPWLETVAAGEIPVPEQVARVAVGRWLRRHALVTPDDIGARYGIGIELVRAVLDDMVSAGMAEKGRFIDEPVDYYVGNEVLARVRRRALAELRARVKPVEQDQFAAFFVGWHELETHQTGPDALLAAVELLAGYPIPASMLESVVLPARVADYQPAMLDQALAASQISWTGQGGLGDSDGWIVLWPADMTVLIPGRPLDELSFAARQIFTHVSAGGAWRLEDLSGDDLVPAQVRQALWELVWAGVVSADSFAPVRALTQGKAVLRRPPAPRLRRVMRPPNPVWSLPGRWFAVGTDSRPSTQRLVDAVTVELSRYGVLTKASILSEAMTPGYFDAYRVLSAMETQGGVQRGYFVEGLGAAQFALPGAVDRLRRGGNQGMVLVAACDPANPWGAGLAWPDSQGHRPGRKAGAIVVLDNGRPVIYLERGAHTIVSFSPDLTGVDQALSLVGQWVDQRRLDTITITRINNQSAFEARDWAAVLEQAGFTLTPQGYRRRERL